MNSEINNIIQVFSVAVIFMQLNKISGDTTTQLWYSFVNENIHGDVCGENHKFSSAQCMSVWHWQTCTVPMTILTCTLTMSVFGQSQYSDNQQHNARFLRQCVAVTVKRLHKISYDAIAQFWRSFDAEDIHGVVRSDHKLLSVTVCHVPLNSPVKAKSANFSLKYAFVVDFVLNAETIDLITFCLCWSRVL